MGSSRDYNGTTSVLSIGDASQIQNIFSSGGTAMAWIYVNTTGENSSGRVFNKTNGTSSSPTAGWAFAVRNGTTASDIDLQFLRKWSSSTGIPNWQINDVLFFDEWNYVGVTYSDSSTANNPSFWVNGVNLGSGTEQTPPSGSAVSDATYTLHLGNSNNNDRTFDGLQCYYQIWNRILSESEIIESMYKPGSITENLVGYWPCMGDSPERDLSGNGNTGTVTGTSISANGSPVTRF